MASDKKRKSKLLKKCCCLTLKVGAFIVAVCFLIGIVLSFTYSLYNVLLRGKGNAERRIPWQMKAELRKEIYRCAVRAQQSYERICTEGKQNFTDSSIADAWNKRKRTIDVLRFINAFKRPSRRRFKRSGSFISGNEENFTERELAEQKGVLQTFEGKTDTHATPTIKNAVQEEREIENVVAPMEKLSENTPFVAANEEPDAAWFPEIAVVRRRRNYNHLTMDESCVVNAERAKRIAATSYYDLISKFQDDFYKETKIFYWRLDLSNMVICAIFYILIMMLLWGIVIDSHVLVLLWLATFPFYFIFSLVYMYMRFVLMMGVLGSNKGALIYAVILIILIPLVIFKYFVIFCYYCFMFTPEFWTMYTYNNMQMIVSRRGVDPNVNIKREKK